MKTLDSSSIGKKQSSEVINHVRDVWSRRYSQTTPDKPRTNTNDQVLNKELITEIVLPFANQFFFYCKGVAIFSSMNVFCLK